MNMMLEATMRVMFFSIVDTTNGELVSFDNERTCLSLKVFGVL